MYDFNANDDGMSDSQSLSESFDSESIIDNYMNDDEKRGENVQINTHQLLDDIHDKYLVELPDDLFAALKMAEDTKVALISELFAYKILQIEMELAENENNERI